jgi:hypothetical protein
LKHPKIGIRNRAGTIEKSIPVTHGAGDAFDSEIFANGQSVFCGWAGGVYASRTLQQKLNRPISWSHPNLTGIS